MTDPPDPEIRDTGPVALGGGRVTITSHGGPAAGRDLRIDHLQQIGTFNQYVVQQERPAGPRTASPRPYPGLRPFGEGWEAYFHGRARETEELLALLARSPLCALVGSSGCGKSSLVAAGLAPALRGGALPGSERWTVRLLGASPLPVEQLCAALRTAFLDAPPEDGLPTPEELRADPALFGRLSARLARRTGGRVVWLLDQFESLLAPDLPEGDRACVARAVLSVRRCAPHVHAVLAVRTDLYHRLEADPELATEVAAHQFWLPPLTGDGLRAAVRGPATAVGLAVEDRLVDRIVADADAGPGSLPLIAYALGRIWERDDSAALTLAAYEEIGGIAAALDQGAQTVWQSLDAAQCATARRVLLRLAHVGHGERPTRRVAFARDLVTATDAEAEVLAVVDRFVRARLLLVGRDPARREPTVEVAHEVLLEQWRTLRDWLADDRAAKRLLEDIAARTADWQDHDHDEGFLLPYGQLRLLDRLDPEIWPLNARERAYVDASRLAEVRALRTRERARTLQRRWLVTAVCLVLALAATATLVWAQRRTEQARTAAEALRLAAQARSAVGERRDVAALLAGAAVATDDTPDTRAALVDTLAGPGGQLALHRLPFAPTALAGRPAADGTLVLGAADGRVHRLDPVTGAPRGTPPARHRDAVTALAQTDTLLVSGDTAGGVLVTIGTTVVRLALPRPEPVTAVAADPRTGVVLAAGAEGTLARWRLDGTRATPLAPLRTGVAITSLAVHRPGARAAATTDHGHLLELPTTPDTAARPLSDTMLHAGADGATAVTALPGGGLAAVDGLRLHVRPPGDRAPASVPLRRSTAVVVAGDTVYTGDATGRIRPWSGSGTAPRQSGETLTGPPESVTALATDGRLLTALTEQDRLVVWDLGALRSPAALPAPTPGNTTVTALAHGPAGTLAIGDSTGTVRLTGPGPYAGARVDLPPGPVTGLAWTGPTGLAAATADGTVHGIDLPTRAHRPVATRPGAPLVDLRAAPDGTLAAAWRDHVLIHAPDGATTTPRGLPSMEVRALALGPHGELAVSVGEITEPRVLLWAGPPATTEPRTLTGHVLYVAALAFSPDGRTLATGSDDRTAALFDVRTGTRLRALTGHDDTVTALAWSADGRLATGAEDGTVRLWDTRGPEPGRVVGRPLHHSDADVTALSATPDGHLLAAAQGTSTVEWPLSPTAWRARACTFATGVTAADLREYAGNAEVPVEKISTGTSCGVRGGT